MDCKNCGCSDTDRPQIFAGLEYCSGKCRKALDKQPKKRIRKPRSAK